MRRVLVAGKGSYIGHRLVTFCEENNLPCEVEELDVEDDAWRDADLSGFDSVVLVAGIAHRRETAENAHLYYEVNRDLAYDAARVAKSAGIPHFVMLSTMSVYGLDEGVITPETTPDPKTHYGRSKLEGEALVRSLVDEGFKVAILRPPMVYGPGCKGNFTALRILAERMPVFPLVDNERSAIYVDNLCAFILSCVAERREGTFFPQDEERMNTSEAVRVLAEARGGRVVLSPAFGLGVTVVGPAVRKARKAFGSLVYEGTERDDFAYCVVDHTTSLRLSAIETAQGEGRASGRPRVTLVAGYYPPEQSADTRLNMDLAENLSALGMVVTVVVPFPNRNVTQEVQERYLKKRDVIEGPQVRVIRVGKPSQYHQGIILRGLEFLSKSASLYWVARNVETDAYLVVSTPPFLGYVAALLARRSPVVFKLQDVFPDSLMSLRGAGDKNPVFLPFRVLERWVYKSVTTIVVPSDDVRKTISTRGATRAKTKVINDWVDTAACYPIERGENHLFDSFGLDRKYFYACYAGNIGQLQDLETVVEAARILQSEDSMIRLVVIGDGSKKDAIDARIAELSLTNIACFPMQPTSDIASVYSMGDVGIVSLKPGITRIAFPSKTWDILSAGRATICQAERDSQIARLLKEARCGIAVDPGNARSLADALIELHARGDETRQMGMRGRELLLGEFSMKRAMNSFRQVICDAIRETEKIDGV